MKFLLVCISTTFAFLLHGQILDIPHFKDIKNYIDVNTCIIVDVDDTLIVPIQTLGTDAWFLYRVNQLELLEKDTVNAFHHALAEWEAIRQLTKVKIVEEGTERLIEELQQSHTVMGLTTQGLALSTCTIKQLQSLNIDLTKTAPSDQDHYFMNQHGVLYRKGILFTSGTPKGAALLKFFDILKYYPLKVVFINDKESHLRDIGEALKGKGIQYIGLRYSYSDERIKKFRSDIAEIQWKYSHFDELMSDESAESYLQNIRNISN